MVREEWRDNNRSILLAGLLNSGGYVLVLVAMTMANVTYVIAVRQLSVVFGVVLGTALLQESCGRIRLAAAATIFLGIVVISLG